MRGLHSTRPKSARGIWTQISQSLRWSIATSLFLLAGCSSDRTENEFNSVTSELHSLSEAVGLIQGTLSLCEIDLQVLPTSTEEGQDSHPLKCEIADDLSLVEASLREIDIIELHIKSLETESKRSYFYDVLKKEKARLQKRQALLMQGEVYFQEMWSSEDLEGLGCKFQSSLDDLGEVKVDSRDRWECPVSTDLSSTDLTVIEGRHQFLQERQIEIQRLSYFSQQKNEVLSFRLTYERQSQIEELMKALHGLSSSTDKFDVESVFRNFGIQILLPLNEGLRHEFVNSLRLTLKQNSSLFHFTQLNQGSPKNVGTWIFQTENFKEESLFRIEIQKGKPHFTLSLVESDFNQIPQILENLFKESENIQEILKLTNSASPRINTEISLALHSLGQMDNFAVLIDELTNLNLLESLFAQIENRKQLPLEIELYSESLRERRAELSLREDRLVLGIDRSLISDPIAARTEFEQAVQKYEASEVETLSPTFTLDLSSPLEQNRVTFQEGGLNEPTEDPYAPRFR